MPRKSDYDIWFDKYKPILVESLETEDKSPRMYETYGEDIKLIKLVSSNHIWTLLDVDGKLYLCPGFHIVNRINYFVCLEKWDNNSKDYKY